VFTLARRILWIATAFQLADGTQVVMAGALRGWADTRSSMLANLIGHWAVGLPLGLIMAFSWGWGIFGIWIGLSAGLVVVASSLLARWSWITRSAPLSG
jgi:MATE family multidrug resistance protein